MRKECRNHVYIVIFILITLCAVAAGGCGGSGGGEKLYVMGGMHGDLADELNEICDVESYDGLSADAPLIISREDGFSTDENTAAVVRKFLDAGMSVGLEHADEREINDFLDTLGLKGDFVMPSGNSYVEYYGVKILSGDIFSYVMLNDDESLPELLNEFPGRDRIRRPARIAGQNPAVAAGCNVGRRNRIIRPPLPRQQADRKRTLDGQRHCKLDERERAAGQRGRRRQGLGAEGPQQRGLRDERPHASIPHVRKDL